MALSNAWWLLAVTAVVGCGGGRGEAIGVEDSDVTSCATGSTVQGVDVSKWDGTIDWTSVKSAGNAFAFIRVSDGLNSPDSYFASNWANAKAAGVYRGVYQYFEANQDPTAQANLVLSSLKGDLGELPAVVDVEVTDGESAATIRKAVDTWSSIITQGTGRAPIIYVSPGFWPSMGGAAETDGLWVANWGVSCPSLPSAWSSWLFWQYSDTGSVSGISDAVDLNRFNGSLAQLAAYASGGSGGGSSSSGSSSGGSSSGGSGGSSSGSGGSGSSGGSSSGSSSGGCSGSVPPGDIARSTVIANAEEWVTAKLQYCQSANGEPDADSSCSATCERTSNAEWDPYRSDCSGFVSWAWQLPAPGLVTDDFAPFDTSASTTIQCTDLQPGDAANRDAVGHMVLFKEWITAGTEAVFIEEPGCSSSTPYAHEFTSAVTCSGSVVNIAYEGAAFTAIRYNQIADDPCGGSSSGSSSGGSSSSSGSSSGGSSSGGASCTSDGQCNPGSDGSGLICVGGQCVAGCNADWECPGSTTCVGGQCQ
ncbi:MAG TPA: GH25 family lysozyme [Polyangiaceae bacterium]